MIGTDFQKKSWRELVKIPYGETRRYANQAKEMGNPNASITAANANAANQFAIIIPCHRVINNNVKLGGYAGELDRKNWLLEHERSHS